MKNILGKGREARNNLVHMNNCKHLVTQENHLMHGQSNENWRENGRAVISSKIQPVQDQESSYLENILARELRSRFLGISKKLTGK